MNALPWLLVTAFIADLVLGDPLDLPHPVRWMGTAITSLEDRFRFWFLSEKVAGAFMAVSLVIFTWLICAAALSFIGAIHPNLGLALHVILIYYTISVKSLRLEALKVYAALKQNNLTAAKVSLSEIVGRNVEPLNRDGSIRATIETVAENLVDGVIAPLFFATLGGGPLAMAYKMINTLDSMIGHRNRQYEKFGWLAARLDDVANYIPARISAVVIALAAELVKLSAIQTMKTAVKDGRKHLSPNAGIPEAAFAGALGIRLGGSNFYGERLIPKPHIGEDTRPVHTEDIHTATSLMTTSAVVWLIFCWAFLIA